MRVREWYAAFVAGLVLGAGNAVVWTLVLA